VTAQSPDPAPITVVPATPDRWPDIQEMFANMSCCCQYWRVSAGQYGRGTAADQPKAMSRGRAALQSQLERPTPPGMLAYVDGKVVGWCGIGPRHEMERLVRSRTIPKVDDLPVWSIVCFLVRVGHRRKGVARALLQGVIECAREHGVPALEAYPVDPGGRRIDVTFAYVGLTPMFEKAGFRRVLQTSARSASLPRWLMRLEVAKGGT
jgi:GNAT superfamily N-acetyltransferase